MGIAGVHFKPAERFYLHRVELENIRGFRSLTLDFETSCGRPRMQTVVVGRNGTCKTTLLRAIALAFADEQEAAALLSAPNGRWLTEGETRGVIRLHVESADGAVRRELELKGDARRERVKISQKFDSEVDVDELAGPFLCAYGMGRGHVGGELGRGYRVQDSVATLFRYEEPLVQSGYVLLRLEKFLGERAFRSVLNTLTRALGLGSEYEIQLPKDGGVEVMGPDLGAPIPLEAWADGYRMTFSWMLDFFGWAMRAGAIDKDGETRGILLVDEIEQHLHPEMQRGLLAHLERALPRTQVVVTTHSPQVALSARSDQIVALHRDGPRIRRATAPNLDAYSVEDVLVEEALFGTDPYSPATRRRLDRHLELTRIPVEERSEEQIAELKRLAATLDPTALPGVRDDPVVAKLTEIEALLRRGDSRK